MLVAPLLNSSGTDKGLQFGVGEVVNGEYRVRGVEADEQGRVIHKCSRLSNGENVVVFFEGRNGQLGARPPNQSSHEMPSASGTQPAGRFEIQFGNDVFTYVVYAERAVEASCRQQADFARARPFGQARQRPGPHGARSVVYRKEECELEVDIPADGCNGDCACCACLSMVFVAFSWLLALIVVPTAFEFDLAVGALSLMFSLTIISFVYFFLITMIADAFAHESLTITPSYFKIKRKLELKRRRRDSVNNAIAAAKELTCLDTILCQQVFGYTRNLWKAKVELMGKRDSDCDGKSTEGVIVLMEPPKEHRLGGFLTLKEKDWLVQEINEVLRTIQDASEERSKSPMTPLDRKAR